MAEPTAPPTQPNMYYESQNYNNGQQQQQPQPAPAYKYLAGNGGTDLALSMPSPGGLLPSYKEAPRWSWCSTSWSVISLLCCCSNIFGFTGLLCSVFSYVDHKTGDFDRSAYKRRCSWGCSVTGILLTLLGVLAVILVFIVFPEKLRETLSQVGYTADPLKDWEA